MTNEELRKLCDAATPGPWFTWRTERGRMSVQIPQGWLLEMMPYGTADDAEFIAAAREAVPRLLDEVEKLRCDLGEDMESLIVERNALQNALIAIQLRNDKLRQQLSAITQERNDLRSTNENIGLDDFAAIRKSAEGKGHQAGCNRNGFTVGAEWRPDRRPCTCILSALGGE